MTKDIINMTKLVCISDTHNRAHRLDIPEGDILIHAGDATNMGTIQEIAKFNEWLGTQKPRFKHILFIAGNHDWLFETNNIMARSLITNATYLQDSHVLIDGLLFYGSPWQPRFCNWAFNLDRGESLREIWNKVPEQTDVLITHGPPMFYLDSSSMCENVGCLDLNVLVTKLRTHFQLKTHIFGHIHGGYGTSKHGNTTFVNAASLDEDYEPTNKPIVIDL